LVEVVVEELEGGSFIDLRVFVYVLDVVIRNRIKWVNPVI
jgi:hypothetical protein